MKGGVKKHPSRDMVNGLSFGVYQELTESRVVTEQAIVR
jgi:hypothetical protein